LEDVNLKNRTKSRRENAGITRILETIIAAAIILIAFTAASFFISDSKTAALQDRTDLDRLGYNVLSKLTESGTIEATIEQTPPAKIELKTFVQNSLPSSMLFNLSISKSAPGGTAGSWATIGEPITVSNVDGNSLSNSIAVSSTPMMFTSKNGNIYYLVLVLASPGEGTD
jgi:hypothetical protein